VSEQEKPPADKSESWIAESAKQAELTAAKLAMQKKLDAHMQDVVGGVMTSNAPANPYMPTKSGRELYEAVQRQLVERKYAGVDPDRLYVDDFKRQYVGQSTVRPRRAPMVTASGIPFDILNPHPENVDIVDVAHHLSRINRFTGAIKFEHYSVAQHSILCAKVMRIMAPQFELHALLHDAHEAYIGDISTPMKNAIEAYAGDGLIARVEQDVESAVWRKLGKSALQDKKLVKTIDLWACWRESHDVLAGTRPDVWRPLDDEVARRMGGEDLSMLDKQLGHITAGWSPDVAKAKFLQAYIDAVKRCSVTAVKASNIGYRPFFMHPRRAGKSVLFAQKHNLDTP
jgi:hypothetical protein